jgi:hypothetical protein
MRVFVFGSEFRLLFFTCVGEELEEWLNALIAQKGVSGVSGAEAVEMTRKLYSQGKGGKLADR